MTLQYLLIISHDADFQPTESLVGDIFAWIEDATAQGKRIAGKPLQPADTAQTIRIRDGREHIVGGPFSDSAEQMCAFELVDCRDQDEALELARRHPMAKAATIEVRPVWMERESE